MLERWTRVILRRRFIVIVCWVAVVVIGVLAATRLPARLSTSLAVPGTGSAQADTLLTRHFGVNTEGTFTVIFRITNPSSSTIRELDRDITVAATRVPSAHATSLQSGRGILYGDIVTALDIAQAAPYTATLRRELSTHGLPPSYVTGEPAIQYDVTPILAADLRKGELIAGSVALVLLIIVLGFGAAVLLPFAVAACTTTAALAIVYGLSHAFLMVLYVPNLIELIGLGLAIDYSLLVVNRFREELRETSRTVDDAIVNTMVTAGRSVLFSGIAVAIGLSALLIMPVPFVRSLGIAGLLVPLVSIAAALTLQPALLSLFGRGGMRNIRLLKPPRAGRDFWSRLIATVLRHRLVVLTGAGAVLVAAMAPLLWLHLTPGSISTIPQFTESARGLSLLNTRVEPGIITPLEVVLDAGASGKARTSATSAATLGLARELLKEPEVFVVVIGSKPPYVDPTGRYRLLIAIGRHDFGNAASRQLVTQLRSRLIPAAHFPANVRAYVGGAPAEGVDFLARVYGSFPWIILVVLGLSYLALLRAFRSLLLPLMAMLLDALSLAATYGLLVVVFRFGVGADVLGLYRTPQIEAWIPVFLFATLFGLSMDYEVFLVTRMREAWDLGADNAEAVAYGLERSGRVVSAAALVMVAALSGFIAGRVIDLQELGVGLALGVLLDATIVRGMLMPSLMGLLGRWNWWLPAPAARLVGIQASPLALRVARPTR